MINFSIIHVFAN